MIVTLTQAIKFSPVQTSSSIFGRYLAADFFDTIGHHREVDGHVEEVLKAPANL
jgi:hypothetical protein